MGGKMVVRGEDSAEEMVSYTVEFPYKHTVRCYLPPQHKPSLLFFFSRIQTQTGSTAVQTIYIHSMIIPKMFLTLKLPSILPNIPHVPTIRPSRETRLPGCNMHYGKATEFYTDQLSLRPLACLRESGWKPEFSKGIPTA